MCCKGCARTPKYATRHKRSIWYAAAVCLVRQPPAAAQPHSSPSCPTVQSGRGPPEAPAADGATSAVDPGIYPLWAANITGAGQVIGIGDTGLGGWGGRGACCCRWRCWQLSMPARNASALVQQTF